MTFWNEWVWPYLVRAWAWVKWFFACVMDGTFGIVKRPLELMACTTYMVCALVAGLWLGSAWAKHVTVKQGPLGFMLAPAERPTDLALAADNAKLEHQTMLLQNTNSALVKEINSMRASYADASDTPRKVACDPVVKWKRYCPRTKTVMEELGLAN